MAHPQPRWTRVVTLSLGHEFARIWAEIEAEDKLRETWIETTPWVLVRYPRFDREKRIALARLGRIHAWELAISGPRGGKGKARKTLDVFGSGYAWNKCDVPVVTADVLKAVEAIDRAIDALKKRKVELFAERFYDLDPLTWEAIQEAGTPWRRIHEALEAYKKGEATRGYVQDVLREILG